MLSSSNVRCGAARANGCCLGIGNKRLTRSIGSLQTDEWGLTLLLHKLLNNHVDVVILAIILAIHSFSAFILCFFRETPSKCSHYSLHAVITKKQYL